MGEGQPLQTNVVNYFGDNRGRLPRTILNVNVMRL